MSTAEQLLKSPSLSASAKNNLIAVDDYVSRSSSSDASISKVVQDVVRNICHSKRLPRPSSGLRGSSKTMKVDDCVESVIRSCSPIDHLLSTPMFSLTAETIEEVDDDEQAADDMEPPPKLTANKPTTFDQYRYRKRKKRRLFSRPTRRYPMKLSAVSNGTGAETAPPKRRLKRSTDNRSKPASNTKIENSKVSQLNGPVHLSVFLSDQGAVTKSKSQRKRNHENSSGTVPICWHSAMNEQLFPHLRVSDQDLSTASAWSVDQVTDFVKALPACPALVAEKFRQEQIDGEAFLLLTQHDIIKLMNIRLGPALKIYNAILILKHKRVNSNIKSD